MKRCSKSEIEDMRFDINKNLNIGHDIMNLSQNQYVACIYDNNWWIGIIESVNDDEKDFDIKFMHPYGPASSFHWPNFNDKCIIPMYHILTTVHPPTTNSH